MITYLKSNLFFSPAKVLVNTVNTQGVMGKGIAKEYKRLFPEMFEMYRDLCEKKEFSIGQLFLYKTSNKWILNFPTKSSWRMPSKTEYIEKGLKKFVETYLEKGITSIAFPPLGCGNGELNWENDVRPMMEKYLKDLPIDVYVHLYTPVNQEDVPEHKHIKNVSKWLHGEPHLLSLNEVLENLKRETIFLTKPSGNLWQGITITEDYDIIVEIQSEKKIFYYQDLFDFWSILRKHGVISVDNAPPTIEKDFTLLVEIFSVLPYFSKVEASVNYKRFLDKKTSLALQFLPEEKTEFDRQLAV